MDPIRARLTPNVTPLTTAADSGKQVADATRKFDVSSAPQAATTQATSRPVFSQMSSVINDAVGKSMTRDQVRDHVVDHEVKSQFGSQATPEMTAAISESFKNDPHLSQLFNQLYSKATAGQK